MPEWFDNAIIISVKKFGEQDGVISFLTGNHGRYVGLCKGAFSKRLVGTVQLGNLVQIKWNARLEEHLGKVKVELESAYASRFFSDSGRLLTLSCLCGMCSLLPERENVTDFFEKTLQQIILLETENFQERYARWEVELLKTLGFGLDLSSCALTGTTEDLVYVSPRTGRAVCRSAGLAWKDRLLPLPTFLKADNLAASNTLEVKKALDLTGFFLENHVSKTLDCSIPAVRRRLVYYLQTNRLVSGVENE